MVLRGERRRIAKERCRGKEGTKMDGGKYQRGVGKDERNTKGGLKGKKRSQEVGKG